MHENTKEGTPAVQVRHMSMGCFTKVLPFSSRPCFSAPKVVLELIQPVDYPVTVEAALAAITSFSRAPPCQPREGHSSDSCVCHHSQCPSCWVSKTLGSRYHFDNIPQGFKDCNPRCFIDYTTPTANSEEYLQYFLLKKEGKKLSWTKKLFLLHL